MQNPHVIRKEAKSIAEQLPVPLMVIHASLGALIHHMHIHIVRASILLVI